MTIIEALTAGAYGISSYELAQRILATGVLLCAPTWLCYTRAEKWPWHGALGAMAHTVLAIGALLVIWTAPI